MLDTTSNNFQSCITNLDATSVNYEWKIKNFSLLIYKFIESFVFSNENYIKGQLYVHTCHPTSSKLYVSIDLIDYEINEDYKYSFIGSIIKHDGSECNRSTDITYEDWSPSLHFMTYHELVENGFLKYDTLHIKCTLKWCHKNVKYNSQVVHNLDQNFADEDYDKDSSKAMTTSHPNETFSDVCIEVGDCKFRVHKNILSSRSSVFATMFRNMKENEDLIKINEVKPDVMKLLIQYIYTNHVEDEDKTIELLKAADIYDLKELKLLCEDSFIKSLTVDNVCFYAGVAHAYNLSNLKQDAISFIKNNI